MSSTSVSIQQILQLQELKDSKLLAGLTGVSKEVSDVHILSRDAAAADLSNLSSQLLILDNVNLGDDHYQIDVILRKAHDSHASGLLIVNFKKSVGPTALRLANKLGMPLIMIENVDSLQLADEIRRQVRTPFIARSDAILRVTDRFRRFARTGENNQALKILAEELHGRTALLGITGAPVATSEGQTFPIPPDFILRDGLMVEKSGDSVFVFQPLQLAAGERPSFWLAIEMIAPSESWIQVVREVLNFSAWFFATKLSADRLVQERDARFRLGVLNAITATKEFPDPGLINQLGILGWRVDGWCTAIYLQSVGEVDALRILNGSPEFRKHLEEIGFVGPVIERPDGFTAWQVEKEEPHSKSFSLLLQNFQQLLGKLEKTSPGLRNYIGIGRPYQGILGLQKSLNEARESCTIAQLSGKPYDAQHIDEMGVRRILLGWYASESFTEFATSLLSAIQDTDADGELLKTLETYLDNNCSPSDSANILGIHRNTVLNRIERIRQLIRVDLNQPDERLALQLACRVIKKANVS